MARLTREALGAVARQMYGVEIDEAQLERLRGLVEQALSALEKSARVGLREVEPAIVYIPTDEAGG